MINLSGRTALVTGASRGIGAAIARRLEDAGAEVFVTATKPSVENNKKLLVVDFSDQTSTANFLEKVKEIDFDILVNNAGINRINPIEDILENDWEDIQRVNLTAPMLLMKNLSSKMKSKKFGRIVNITSIFSEVSKSGRASYSSSKFGLVGLTKAVALDLAKYNILVNSVAPGFIDTELTRSVLSQKEIDALVAQVPQQRLGTVDEIAECVCFLVSEGNSFMTGQNVILDGGFTCV